MLDQNNSASVERIIHLANRRQTTEVQLAEATQNGMKQKKVESATIIGYSSLIKRDFFK